MSSNLHIDPSITLNAERVQTVIGFFQQPDSSAKQRGVVEAAKMRSIRTGLGCGIAMIAGMALVGFLGWAMWHGNKSPSMGIGVILFFIGVAGIVDGIRRILKSSFRSPRSSAIEPSKSIQDLCEQHYRAFFCEKSTDIEEMMHRFFDSCHFFPAPVIESYSQEGWALFTAASTPEDKDVKQLHCSTCDKKLEKAIRRDYLSLPIELGDYKGDFKKKYGERSEETIKTDFKSQIVRCEKCQNTWCLECLFHCTPKEGRYLCPVCGGATYGTEGLAERWARCRQTYSANNIAYTLSDLTVQEKPRSDLRIKDITVNLSGTPFGNAEFKNVALNIEGNWFLVSPEPIR